MDEKKLMDLSKEELVALIEKKEEEVSRWINNYSVAKDKYHTMKAMLKGLSTIME